MGWTRRTFLVALATSASLGLRPSAAEEDLGGFLDLSAALAEVPRERLSPAHAARYSEAIRLWARPDDLRALVRAARQGRLGEALEVPARRRLAEAILEAWYTGTVETPGGVVRIAGADALAWSVLPHAGPPGTCRGR